MQSTKRLLIVGSGKRVRETALPALQRIAASFEVRRVFARTAKEIGVEGKRYDVEPLAALDARVLAGADLVYVAVGKDAVPKVLAHLVALDPSRVDLLIDTPVVRFKHFRHTALLACFRNAWVAEDCAYLPWFDTVREACANGPLGRVQHVLFDRSVYAYHGLATAKALFGSPEIVRARRKRVAGGARRELELEGGGRAEIVEPRDYATGAIIVRGERGIAFDREPLSGSGTGTRASSGASRAASSDASVDAAVGASALPHFSMRAIADGIECRGFRIGDVETHLDPAEISLARGDPPDATITARTQALKRVGFLRLLRAIESGRGAYPIGSGVDDMIVDYFLEKLGFWRARSIMDPRSGLGRTLLSAVTRFGGG